jgi:peptidoglycan/LPS O-acetylase OafA/YrhL
MSNRIKPVDGLRAVAVIGVLWAHTWMFFGNIPFKIGSIDVNRLLSFGGNGVDLFFVISGFCMYLMHAKKNIGFSFSIFSGFLKKRFKRIAPAFYTLIIVETLFTLAQKHIFPTASFFQHISFTNLYLANNEFSPHYWSLATEMQFYIVLPLLFYGFKSEAKVLSVNLVLILISIILTAIHFYFYRADILNGITISYDSIIYRYAEFGWGIVVAILFMRGYRLPKYLLGFPGFIIGFAIAFFGRTLKLTEFLQLFGSMSFIIKAFSEPLMAFGFAVILFNVMVSKSIMQDILLSRPFQFIGRISYSFYLWHWLIATAISNLVINYLGRTSILLNLSFVISLFAVVPIAFLSYRILEAPYFKIHDRAEAIDNKVLAGNAVTQN